MTERRNSPHPGWTPKREASIADLVIVFVLFVAPVIYMGVWALWLR